MARGQSMIRPFRDAATETIARGKAAKGFPADLVQRAIRKLTMPNYATSLDDLRSSPGNRLEALRGDRKG
jgi:proteic killer suppression protein